MNRSTYINLRTRAQLQIQRHALAKHFFQDTLIVASTFFLFMNFQDSWVQIVAVPLGSILMFRNFSLMHDAVHGCVSKNKILNDAVGIISGSLCLLPYEQWKHVHLQHHYWSGNVEKDPVTAIIRTFPKWPPFFQKWVSFTWKAWIPFLALCQYTVFWWHSGLHFLKNVRSSKNLLSVIVPVLFWATAIRLLPANFIPSLLLPSLALYLLAVEVVNFPHHLGMEQLHGDAKLPIWDQYKVARSCTYPLWLSRFIVLNFNYHIEHHMFPDVPWYHLDKLATLVKTELKDEYNCDPQFAWILKNRPRPIKDILLTVDADKAAA